MVILYHLNAYSIVKELPFFVNAYLFVDFFFVLSGFVIATNYQARLSEGFGIQKFMLLRFGRLYPLYFFVLLCFFLLEAFLGKPIAFASPQKSLDTVFANIFLLQSFDIFSFDTWNWPGWSIATEFWTCLIYAIIAYLWPKRIIVLLLVLSFISLLIIANQSATGINVTYNFGMLRSITGFSTGVFVFEIWKRTINYKIEERIAFIAETFCVIFVFIFVSFVGQSVYSLFAPLVFAIVVFIFAKEAGPISRFLEFRLFVVLGLLSYSIYLVHLLVERLIVQGALSLEALTAQPLISKIPHAGEIIDVLGRNYTEGNFWAGVYLILVVGVAALTYRFIEVPSRLWFRKKAQVERP